MFKFTPSLRLNVLRVRQFASQHPEKWLFEESEYIYQVKVDNLPVNDTTSSSSFLRIMGMCSIKKAPKWTYAYVNLKTEQEAIDAVNRLTGLEFKNEILSANYTRISREECEEKYEIKRKKTQQELENDTRTSHQMIADQVTPLYKMPYDEQLTQKNKINAKSLFRMKRKIAKIRCLPKERIHQITWAFNNTKNSLCEFLDPIGSPIVNGYRNKCNFTIGNDNNGEVTVGFQLGRYVNGHTTVLGSSQSVAVSDHAKRIAKAMEDYVKASVHDVYTMVTKKGTWRSISVRTQRSGEAMINIQINISDIAVEEIEKEKIKLTEFWREFQEKETDIKLKTVLFNTSFVGTKREYKDEKWDILIGDGYIHEDMMGLKFRISNEAFFQVNTPAAEKLFEKCAEWCTLDSKKKPVLLDICCGTGVIGLTMAKSVSRVIGIDCDEQAIKDAHVNAKLNNITNVEYLSGKIEDCDTIFSVKSDEIIAIVDPPR
ncbi:S-adenosyl-L-methionine-dependent methyltransferase [Spinellus fusiger]|nr:S-adenosyl-L-methionine-dependent methyltransferase [Spinellus fusiger]